jgi:hypothetical protein
VLHIQSKDNEYADNSLMRIWHARARRNRSPRPRRKDECDRRQLLPI